MQTGGRTGVRLARGTRRPHIVRIAGGLLLPLLIVAAAGTLRAQEIAPPPSAADAPEAATTAAEPSPPPADDEDQDAVDEEPADGGIAYQVELQGVEDEDLRDLMEQTLKLESLRDRPPATRAGLARRIEDDQERLRTVMRSEGYWNGTVASAFDETTDPPTVVLTVDLGERYVLGDYAINFVDSAVPPEPPDADAFGFVSGEPARGEAIVDATRQLLEWLRENAHPLAERVDRQITVDHRDETVDVTVEVDPGPYARFGPVAFEGLERTEQDYVEQWIEWTRGARFDQSKVDAFVADLRDTGLFSSVRVDLADDVDANGELPMTVVVSEAAPRTIGAGIGYSTDRGAGGRVYWRHRNLFGRDENLEIELRGDFLEQGLTVDFVRPNFRIADRSLFARAEAIRSDTDAFQGFTANALGGLSWPLTEDWQASLAGSIEYSSLEDVEGDKDSFLFGLPGTLTYSGHDDDLNPTKGVRFDLALTPYVGTSSDTALTFAKAEAGLAGYQPLDQDRRYVLAGRVRLGSIVGEETLDIPANKRFYAGGGGSIRGFEFQKVGPLDAEGDPIGGRSLFLVAAEARLRVWGDIGVVPFINGGNVYDEQFPSFDDPLDWAAGLGFRYHTPAGPLRVDFAFPITRRDEVDAFQFYISLGQAF